MKRIFQDECMASWDIDVKSGRRGVVRKEVRHAAPSLNAHFEVEEVGMANQDAREGAVTVRGLASGFAQTVEIGLHRLRADEPVAFGCTCDDWRSPSWDSRYCIRGGSGSHCDGPAAADSIRRSVVRVPARTNG